MIASKKAVKSRKEYSSQKRFTTARKDARTPRPKQESVDNAGKAKILVPDTSVIIEGLISKKIVSKELKPSTILFHEAVMSELESQANQGRETGYLGIEEVKRLKELSGKYNFQIEYTGKRPTEFEIKRAKSGEIDSIIRSLAQERKATLVTADKVQALVAEAKGIHVVLYEFEIKTKTIRLESFFDATTMSVHLRENVIPAAKKGKPGDWEFVRISKNKLTREEVQEIAKEIVEEANLRQDGFIEIQRKGSTIVQLGTYRIVITRPPLADGYEVTAVRPVKKLSLPEYSLSEKLKKRISEQAEGILLAGSPGMGKTTFAQALAEHYVSQHKIVKTVEAPRDLQLPDDITQYAISHGSAQEIHDILLLSRPDHTIFDEMRNTDDFKLFADLRLAGVGMVGVVHATNPIDAIQRFIGRIDLGVIPQIIDTVIFIKDGAVNKVYSVKMGVKVPSGMTEADLARPVVMVNDFETGTLEYEMYSYGEETVVVPVREGEISPVMALASREIEKEFRRYADHVKVQMMSENKCTVFVPEIAISRIIGKQGKTIEETEKRLGISIQVKSMEGDIGSGSLTPSRYPDHFESSEKRKREGNNNSLEYDADVQKNNIRIYLDPKYRGSNINLYVDEDYLLTARVSKKGVISINKGNRTGKTIAEAISSKMLRLVL